MTPMVSEIQEALCAHFGLTRAELLSPCHARRIARPRQVGMWIARRVTKRSLQEIGRLFGGRDHSTVIHGIRQIDCLITEIPELLHDIGAVCSALESIMAERNFQVAA